jgi:hypothetical protein
MFRTRSSALRSALLAAVVGGTLAAAALVPGGSASAARSLVPDSGLLFGATVYSPDGSSLPDLEAQTGRRLVTERIYSQWNSPQPDPRIARDLSFGRTPVVSVRPQLTSGTKISWARVASGALDADIRTQAKGLASVKGTVLLAFHHEADLQSGYGTSAEFRAAFRHYVAVVRATGETNIQFVVIVAGATYGSAIANWYPGDDVVDWAGADSYNFGSCRAGAQPWRSFADATAKFRAWGSTHSKPQILAEWGSAEDPAQAGRKAQWITDAGKVMSGWPQLRAAAYFDQSGSCDWRLTTSSSALKAFTTLARSPLANGAASTNLTASVMSGKRTVKWQAGTATGAHHPTGTGVTKWSFDPGDGTGVLQGSGAPGVITHTYRDVATFSATLTVRDATNGMFTTHQSVTTS